MIKKILVAIDFSDITPAVVKTGIEMAKAFNSKIILMYTEPLHNPSLYEYCYMPNNIKNIEIFHNKELKNDEDALTLLVNCFKNENINIETCLMEGFPTETIVEKIKTENINLLVIGNHKHNKVFEVFTKNVSTNLSSSLQCPILIVPACDYKYIREKKNPL